MNWPTALIAAIAFIGLIGVVLWCTWFMIIALASRGKE